MSIGVLWLTSYNSENQSIKFWQAQEVKRSDNQIYLTLHLTTFLLCSVSEHTLFTTVFSYYGRIPDLVI